MSEQFMFEQNRKFFDEDKNQSVSTSKWFDSLYPKTVPSFKDGVKNVIDKLGDVASSGASLVAGDAVTAAGAGLAAVIERSSNPDASSKPDAKAATSAMLQAGKAAVSAVENLPKLIIGS